MPATENFTITLPTKAANFVRQRVADGEFESPSAYFEDLMIADVLNPPPTDAELVQWMNTEGVRRSEQVKAHPESAITPEQMDALLLEDSDETAHEAEER